jgi:hypothetical protein
MPSETHFFCTHSILFSFQVTKKDSEISSDTLLEADTVFKYDDFVFLIDDRFKRKKSRETSLDRTLQDVISFEMIHGDDNKSFGYTNILLEDVKTLDLPIMYYKPPANLQVVDYYGKFEEQSKGFNSSSEYLQGQSLQGFSWLKFDDFTDDAVRIYRLLSQRQPLQFPVYEDNILRSSQVNPIGHLPVMLFMLQKPILNTFDKNTGTCSLFAYLVGTETLYHSRHSDIC